MACLLEMSHWTVGMWTFHGKALAGFSSQVDNPATSPCPFPIHCDLPTEENKYSGSERSGFAEPAHIAAETLLATHRRTRCAL